MEFGITLTTRQSWEGIVRTKMGFLGLVAFVAVAYICVVKIDGWIDARHQRAACAESLQKAGFRAVNTLLAPALASDLKLCVEFGYLPPEAIAPLAIYFPSSAI
jgi:hypothetical protein